MHDRHAVLISATLLTSLIVTILALPEYARDLALVVLAMSALGSVLFFWSRRSLGAAGTESGPPILEQLWPDDSPDSASVENVDGYGFLCRTICALTGASLSGIMLLDRTQSNLRFASPWVVKSATGYHELRSGPEVKMGEDPQLDNAIRMRQTRIINAAPFSSMLESAPAGSDLELWAIPLVSGKSVCGALIVGACPGGFSQHADAYLSAVSTFAARIVASEQTRDLCLDQLRRLEVFSSEVSRWGAHCGVEDIKAGLVSAAERVLATDRVAFLLGAGDERRTSPLLPSEFMDSFLSRYGDALTKSDSRVPVVESRASDANPPDNQWPDFLESQGIAGFVACPIRAGLGTNGAVIGFYSSAVPSAAEALDAITIFAGVAGVILSYANAVEQSGRMLDDLAGANQELSLQASVDGLTGLANHRSLQQALNELCMTTKARPGGKFCLMMIDADRFKNYNDAHGHCEGDTALREIAGLISSDLRQGDIAARYGGEEFAVVVQGIGKEVAAGVGDRIRRKIAHHKFRKGTISVSIGIAEFPADGCSPAEVIERADKALYHAKVTGRNRVVTWGCAESSSQGPQGKREKSSRRTVLIAAAKDDDCWTQNAGDNWEATICHSVESAAAALTSQSFDVALVDIDVLPGQDLKALVQLSSVYPDMPLIGLVDKATPEIGREALRHGIYDLVSKPVARDELTLVVERNVERRKREREKLSQASTTVMLQAIEALAAAIDSKDHCTSGHSKRVTSLALMIAEDLTLSDEDRYALEIAAKIHDIGKIALPESALNKQSALTPEEWEAMRSHPAIGSKIVDSIDALAYVSSIIRHHHERLDGSGYPDGLQGGAVPYLSLVIAVADAYEAMTSERAYRSRMSPQQAIQELKRCSGVWYPAELVAILERKLKESGELDDLHGLKAA